MEEFRHVLDRARALGALRVMIPIPGRDDVERDAARALAIESFAEAVPLGKEAGITVTTEHFIKQRAPFIISDDFEQALQAVPDLRITFDNGNVLSGGEDPVHAYTRHHQWIDFIHFKDWTVEPGDCAHRSGRQTLRAGPDRRRRGRLPRHAQGADRVRLRWLHQSRIREQRLDRHRGAAPRT